MQKRNIEAVYPLSPTQQGMLFHYLNDPGTGVYFQQIIFDLHGDLDRSAFAKAWQTVADRHPILRTFFVWEDLGKLLQIVHRQVTLPLEQMDWSAITPQEQKSRFDAFMDEDRRRGFDLSRPPLMRLTLIQTGRGRHVFIQSHHHILLDGWSVSLLLKDVFNLYGALRSGRIFHPEPRRPYRDYIAWLQKQDLEKAEAFWRERLKGFTAPTSLAIDQTAETGRPKGRIDEMEIRLPREATAALQSFARKQHLTLSTLVHGAWALLLGRYGNEEDVVFGSTGSGRPGELNGVEFMLGLFINTLPMRLNVARQQSLLPWLQSVQAQHVAIKQYEYTPLVKVQGWSDVAAGGSLFESILVFENYPMNASLQEADDALKIEDVRAVERTNYALTLTAVPGAELALRFSYDRMRFDDTSITRMLGHLRILLESFTQDPDRKLADLPMLTEAEKRQITTAWNDSAREYEEKRYIQAMFAHQAEEHPDAVAVVFGDQHLSYGELNRRGNQLAHYLRKAGVGPEGLVGIGMERSLEMMIGLFGILKAGAAYVPLEPSYPAERLQYMLDDSRVRILLTQSSLSSRFTFYVSPFTVICLDREWRLIGEESGEELKVDLYADNLAYTIYTSGSTGKPKGAMNHHGGIRNRLLWMQDVYGLEKTDRILQKTPFSFDVSVWEFFWPLGTGACLVMARPGGHKDSAYLVRTMLDEKITTVHFVPSMLRLFVEEQGLEACQGLKRVICSGEALPFDLQERFLSRLRSALHNLYGPTEAAIDVSFWNCQEKCSRSIVPIGRPIANVRLYILDKHLNPVPAGIRGELHIGGIGLARGYLGRPELTAETFIPNPFGEEGGGRLYATGDLARYLPDGSIEFLGRMDHQVKIRGFRIELGEIESVLTRHGGIREVVVTAHANEADDKRLIAYVVPNDGQSCAASDLRRFLEEKLPEYMLPSFFVMLEKMPLTPNGKVDRKALPVPEDERPELETEYIIPRTEMEKAIAAVWAEVLQIEKIGVYDNFFDLGGHSILILLVQDKLKKIFGIKIPIVDMFELPTISALVQYLDNGKNQTPSSIKSQDPSPGLKGNRKRLQKRWERIKQEK